VDDALYDLMGRLASPRNVAKFILPFLCVGFFLRPAFKILVGSDAFVWVGEAPRRMVRTGAEPGRTWD
jgi:hypothetical protein